MVTWTKFVGIVWCANDNMMITILPDLSRSPFDLISPTYRSIMSLTLPTINDIELLVTNWQLTWVSLTQEFD